MQRHLHKTSVQERCRRQLLMQATLRPTKLCNPHEGARYSPMLLPLPQPAPMLAPLQTTPHTSAIAQLRPHPWTGHPLRLYLQCTVSTRSSNVGLLPIKPNRLSASNDIHAPSMPKSLHYFETPRVGEIRKPSIIFNCRQEYFDR